MQKNWSALHASRAAHLRAALGSFDRTIDAEPLGAPLVTRLDHLAAHGWMLAEACTYFDLPEARDLFNEVLVRVAEVGVDTLDVNAPGRSATAVGLMELEVCARNVVGFTGAIIPIDRLAERLLARPNFDDPPRRLRAAWAAMAVNLVDASLALVPQRPFGPLDGLPPRDPTTRLVYLRGHATVPAATLTAWWIQLLDDAPQMIGDGYMPMPMFHAIGRAMRSRLSPFDPQPAKWIRQTVAERIA